MHLPATPPAAAGKADRPAYSDAASAAAWLARLSPASSAQNHAALSLQVRLLPAAAIAPEAKLEILELMRQPVAAVQSELARRCRGAPIPLGAEHRQAWEGVVGLWQAMAMGYDSLIDAMATTAPNLATQAHLICQRALRYTALAMLEHWRVYCTVSGALWQQLHRLYVFSENAGIATSTVNDSVGRASALSTCLGSYAHAVLMQLAQPDALAGAQIEIVDRLLERWESLVALTLDPPPHSSIPALAVDVASRKGAGFAKDMPSAGVRHLNLDALGRVLRQTVASLKQQSPAQLGLGDLPRDACEKLLQLLHVRWCAAGTGRIDERAPTSLKVHISPNLASIHFHISGKPFRQPGGDMTAAERQRQEMLGQLDADLPSQRSGAIETWDIRNQSVSGFLATCRHDRMNHIAYHQLVGLLAPARKTIFIGIVQRLVLDEEGTIWIGLRIILGTPQAVAARMTDGTGHYERALLMPEDAVRKIPASILLLPGWYQPNRSLLIHSRQEAKIKLQALLDRGANFERATYSH
jgi:cyclic-di-GMP-binding protein